MQIDEAVVHHPEPAKRRADPIRRRRRDIPRDERGQIATRELIAQHQPARRERHAAQMRQPELPSVPSADRFLAARRDQIHRRGLVRRDFRRDQVLALARLAHDVERRVQHDGALGEVPDEIGIRHRKCRALAVVERVERRANLVADGLRFHRGSFGPHQHAPAIIDQIKVRLAPAAADRHPAGLGARTRLRVPFVVRISLRDLPRPLLRNAVVVVDAVRLLEITRDRLRAFRRAFDLDQPDENAAGLGSGEGVDEPLAFAGNQRRQQT